jgi:hypothetical protein
MDEKREIKKEEVMEELFKLENPKLAMPMLNFQGKMYSIKKDMVNVLNLLDKISENSNNTDDKHLARTKILDSYNDLPRKTNELILKIIKNSKGE